THTAQDVEVGKLSAQHRHRAGVGRNQADDGADQRRLARAVWSEQSIDLAAPHPQADSVECLDVAETFADGVDLHRHLLTHSSAPPLINPASSSEASPPQVR